MLTRVYLDHCTKTRPFPSAVEKMTPFYKEYWGSLSALHQMGQELTPFAMQATLSLYSSLGAHAEDQFVFTSDHQSAIDQIFLAAYFAVSRQTGATHFITTADEEMATLSSVKRMQQLGCHGKILSVNQQGQLTKESLDAALSPRTALVSLSWANGLTGVIHPILDLAALCKEREVLFHVDATHVIGKYAFRLEDLPLSLLSFDGSRLHAPGRSGGVFYRSSFRPSLASEPPQVDVAQLMALSHAIDKVVDHFDHLCTETARLRDKLEQSILGAIPETKIFFPEVERLPHCSALAFPGVFGEALLYALHRRGVYATIGGGCSQKLSSILVACGVDPVLASSALSFSLSCETTEEEIDYALEVIVSEAKKLRTFSRGIL